MPQQRLRDQSDSAGVSLRSAPLLRGRLKLLAQCGRAEHHSRFETATNIFITPGYQWTIVDGLFTNFHLPKSTLADDGERAGRTGAHPGCV